MSGNRAWQDGEHAKLIALYKKKPFSEDLETWARKVSHKFGRTAHAVRAKIGEISQTEQLSPQLPNVLLLDIETLPLKVWSWGVYKQVISPSNVIQDWSISCWSAKWLMLPDMYGAVVTSEEAVNRSDERILKPLWNLINKADVVIGHNSNKFDIKRLNTRFLFYGMGDTMPFVSIDTLAAARLKFSFTSFKLDYINRYLGLNGKVDDPGMEDYIACANGDRKTLKRMYEYNRKDVLILEELYMRIRSYIKHPNFSSWSNRVVELEEDEEACPVCAKVVTQFGGVWTSPAGYHYAAFRCPHCGAIGRKLQRKNRQSVTVKRA